MALRANINTLPCLLDGCFFVPEFGEEWIERNMLSTCERSSPGAALRARDVKFFEWSGRQNISYFTLFYRYLHRNQLICIYLQRATVGSHVLLAHKPFLCYIRYIMI